MLVLTTTYDLLGISTGTLETSYWILDTLKRSTGLAPSSFYKDLNLVAATAHSNVLFLVVGFITIAPNTRESTKRALEN